MNPIVEEIISLENEYGHNELFNGVEGEEGALDKIALVCNLLDSMDVGSLNRLIGTYKLSPESAAYILHLAYPEDVERFENLDRLYKNRSNEDRVTYRAVYFERKYEETDNKLHLFDKYKLIHEKFFVRYERSSAEAFKGKGAVYTVITGGYDDLNDPEYINPEWDYYCFTDAPDKVSSDVWKIKKIETEEDLDPVRMQRYAKTHPFLLLSEYDYTIYIDGCIKLVGDLRQYINVFSRGCSMLCFPHPARQTLEDEVAAIKELRLNIDPSIRNEFDEQIEFYRNEGYKDTLPLVESGCLVRSNRDQLLNKVMEDWWHEIKTRTHRDQLSIGYVCWKNGYIYDISTFSIRDNYYFDFSDHN